jgi:hypothetical protein
MAIGQQGRNDDVGIDSALDVGPCHRRAGGGVRRCQDHAGQRSDGKQAIQINCNMPGDCQTRAIAMCRESRGNYSVLSMDNMPTRGDASTVRGPAMVVVRCT